MKKSFFVSLFICSSVLFGGCSLNGTEDSKNNESSTQETTKIGMKIASFPYTLAYHVGDTFSSSGLLVKDANGNILSGYTLSIQEGEKLNTAGSIKISVMKEGYKTATFSIFVSSELLLEISTYPRLTYTVGEALSFYNLEVKDSSGNIINDYSTSKLEGYIFSKAGEYSITLSKTGYTSATYTVTVSDQPCLIIDKVPEKTTYIAGDSFSLAGLVVKDNLGNIINQYTSSLTDGSILKYSGTKEIIISVDGYVDGKFTIVVNKKQEDDQNVKTLKVYYINDMHGYYSKDGSSNVGLTSIGKYLKDQKEADSDHTLILSGGDMFQGGYESDITRGQIVVDAMNYIGFDAMALGNHDFDWGEEALEEISSNLNCDIVSCNTTYANGDEIPYIRDYSILEKGDLKIGIIGVAQANLGSSITGSISNNFSFPSGIEEVQSISSALRNEEGCDLILLLTHDGGCSSTTILNNAEYSTTYHNCTNIDPSTNLPYVDGMFFSHDHYEKLGNDNGIPFMEAGCNSENVGYLEFTLYSDGSSYYVENYKSELRDAKITCTEEDAYLKNLPTSSKYSTLITHDPDDTIIHLNHNYLKNGKGEGTGSYLICQAMLWYVNSNPDIFDNKKVYLSSHNSNGVRSNLYAGDFTYRDFYQAFTFENQLYIVKANQTQINYTINRYATYPSSDSDIEYVGGYTYAVSISYLIESKTYGKNMYTEKQIFTKTSQDAIYEYLTKSGADI